MERIGWKRFAIIAFLVLSACPRNTDGDNDWSLDEDTKGWIDPHSMLEPEPFKKTSVIHETCEKVTSDCSVAEKSLTDCGEQVVKLKKDLEKQKELNRKSETTATKEQPFFEQYLRHILSLFTKILDGTTVGHYEAVISLPELSYLYLSSYVTQQNVSVQEVHSILLKLMTKVRWIMDDEGLNDFNAGSDLSFAAQFLYYLNVAGVVAVILVALLQVVALLRRVQMSFSRFVFLFFFSMILSSFVISIPWTWWHLYKKEVAKRMAALSQIPPNCAGEMKGFWRMITSFFFIHTDECQKYYELLEVDPLWEVPPTQAVAVTITRFFLEPAKHIGQAIREFMVSAFEGLPVILWLPVYAFIILLFVLVLFCLGRYRIAMPFMRIEPAHPDGAHQVAALRDRVEQLQLENRDMRRQLAPLPDARGNAVDERGDRRRTPHQLEEVPTGAQVVYRRDVETVEKVEKSVTSVAPRATKTIIPPDIKCVDVPSASLCSTSKRDKTTPVSAVIITSTCEVTREEETITEFTANGLPIAGCSDASAEPERAEPERAEPASAEPQSAEPQSAEPQSADRNNGKQIETNVEDLQQSYVMIERASTNGVVELDENR